ncbi:MAG: TonB-dependent receptor [Acidobacteria bacterium]|nr:TonB-dependent receptor [Acidobacteriota bacterium]
MKRSWIYGALLGLVLGFPASLISQSQSSSADISGRVVDSSEAVLPGVALTATNVETGLVRSAVSAADGTFRLLLLPPGAYDVKVEFSGFASQVRKNVRVTVGQTAVITFKLAIAGSSTVVDVFSAGPLIEVERTQQSDTIDSVKIQNLPINGRNYLDYTLLTPGVTDANANIQFALPQAGTSGLSFAGQGGRSNNVSIDGADNNDYSVGAVRSTMGQDAIQEFQINRSNFSAEFGRSSGGLINIVTKSGTNQYHGSLFAYLRNRRMDARNPFAFGPRRSPDQPPTAVDPPFTRVQTGFTMGGPIRRDKTFFFFSYEAQDQHESQFVTFELTPRFFGPTGRQQQLVDFVNTRLPPTHPLRLNLNNFVTYGLSVNSLNLPTFKPTIDLLESRGSVFPFKNISNTASLRLDHAFSASDQLFGRYNITDNDASGLNFGGLKAPSRGNRLALQDHAAVVSETHIFNPNRINEFRFQLGDRYFNTTPMQVIGPAIDISGLAQLGRDFYLPSVRRERRYQWTDNLMLTRGRHSLKFGADVNLLHFKTDTQVFFGGRFLFAGIPFESIFDNIAGAGAADGLRSFLRNAGRSDLIPNVSARITPFQALNLHLPALYQQGFGDPNAILTMSQYAFYIHDSWRVTPRLLLDLGLRYDFEAQPAGATRFLPKGLNRDKNNIGPRLGFSWDMLGTGKTILRGGYGIFYAPVYQAVTFVGRVLDGSQIVQLVAPLSGVVDPRSGRTIVPPGIARSIFDFALANAFGRRTLTEQDINAFGLRVGTTPPAIFTAAPDVVNPLSHQVSFGIEREVAQDWSVSLNYLANRGVHVIRGRNNNLAPRLGPGGLPLRDPVYGVRLQSPYDPRYVQINVVESSGNSIYHGFTAGVTKRFSRNFQVLAAYTFAKTIDDTTDFISELQPADQNNVRQERSLSAFDQRQRLVLSGVLESPFMSGPGRHVVSRILADISISPIITYGSGRPFNLLFGDDLNGDTNFFTDRPVALDDRLRPILADGEPVTAGRNTGKGPRFAAWDLRVTKRLKFSESGARRLELIFEGFNLFNRTNYSGINPYIGDTPFSQLGNTFRVSGRRSAAPTDPLGFTSAFAPRQLQVAAKLHF